MAGNDNIKVIIKVRPLIKRERDAKLSSQWRIQGDTIECINPLNAANRFVFDEICDETSSTLDLYKKVARPIVTSAVNGFNGTIFAYGQTSSGKTHTMVGNQSEPGITVLAIRQIFQEVSQRQDRSFLLKATYIEIYNEKIYDLLNNRNEVKIQEIANGELHIERKEIIVTSEEGIMKLLDGGNNLRKVAETNMNVQSSRSHAIFSIMIESEIELNDLEENTESPTVVSMLNLVDLAGSERADATGATGNRFKEGAHINKSLLSLSLVINKLSEGQDQHINYRDSKLTRILQLSLGGNAMTAIICTVTPAVVDETNFTLGFASRAKRVKNKPVINHVVSDALSLKKMKKQIAALEEQLDKERKQHNEYIDKEKRLNKLKDGILQYKPAPQTIATNRRRTWAANQMSDNQSQMVKKNLKNVKASQADNFKFSDFGHQIEYSDEQFKSILDASFSTPQFEIVRPQHPKPSLLRTPKSIRNIWAREKADTSIGQASPITTVDKDRYIKRLEDELEELNHFQFTENAQNVESLEKQIEEKDCEIKILNDRMNNLSENNQKFVEQFEAMKREIQEINNAKHVAEQNLTSVQFEYEQHKSRSMRRENELVEQLESLRLNDALGEMITKNKTLVDRITCLETDIWQMEKTHKAEIEQLTSERLLIDEKCNKQVSELMKYGKLQEEYDNVSERIVDCVLENDALKLSCDQQTNIISDLNLRIAELQNQLKHHIAISLAQESEKHEIIKLRSEVEKMKTELIEKNELSDSLIGLKSELKEQKERYEIEFRKLKEKHQQDIIDSQNHCKTVEKELAKQKNILSTITLEREDLAKYCDELYHENNLLNNSNENCRLTVQFISKELEVLRRTYSDLQMKVAEEELGHLKLQKTFYEFNESSNFTQMLDMTETDISRRDFEETLQISRRSMLLRAPSPLEIKKNVSQSSAKVTTDNDSEYEKKYKSIVNHLSSAISTEEAESVSDYSVILDNLIITNNEFNAIVSYMVEKSLNEKIDSNRSSKMIIEAFEKQKTDFENERQSFNAEVISLAEKCDQLHRQITSIQNRNELLQTENNSQLDVIRALENENKNGEKHLQSLIAEEKSLRDQYENEKSTIIHLQKSMTELNDRIKSHQEREKQLNEQNEELNELKTKQKTEISRLQQMVTDSSKLCSDLTKMKAEIETKNKDLEAATKENDKLKSNLSEFSAKIEEMYGEQTVLKKSLDEKNQQIEQMNERISTLEQKSSEIDQLRDANKSKNESIEQLQKEFESTENKLKNAINNINVLNEISTEKENEILKMRSNLCSMNKDVSNKNENIIRLESELQKLSEELKVANAHYTKFEKEIVEKNQEIERMNTEIIMLRKTSTENVELKQELNAVNIELLANRENLAKQIAHVEELELKIGEKEALNTQNNRKNEEMLICLSMTESLFDEKSGLKKIIEELEERVKDQLEQIGLLTNETKNINELKKNLKLANDTYDQLKMEKLKLEEELKCFQNKQMTKQLDTSLEMNMKTARTSTSPMRKSAADINRLLHENNNLKSMQRTLESEIEELRRSSHQVRKIKRHSTHDDTRRISGFDACMIDLGTQTEPSSENCRCNEFCTIIDKLRQDIVIKDARYFTFRRDTGVDTLNEEIAHLKSSLTSTKTELNVLKSNFERLTDKYNTLKLKNSMTKCTTAEVFVQTDDQVQSIGGRTFSSNMDLQHAIERAEKYKRAYLSKEEEYLKIKEAFGKVKKKYMELTAECESKSGQTVQSAKRLDDICVKYSHIKQVCVHRLERINALEKEKAIIEEEMSKLKKKYDMSKQLLQTRSTEFEESRRRDLTNNENIPDNF